MISCAWFRTRKGKLIDESRVHVLYKDGFRILRAVVYLIKEEKPFAFFSVVARLPTALLAASLAIFGFLSFTCGLILDTASRGRAESKRLAYLSVPVRFTSVKSIDPLGIER